MKKLLSLISAISLTTTATTSVVSCIPTKLTITKHNFNLNDISDADLFANVDFSMEKPPTVNQIIKKFLSRYYAAYWLNEDYLYDSFLEIKEIKVDLQGNVKSENIVTGTSIAKPGYRYSLTGNGLVPENNNEKQRDKINSITGTAEFKYMITLSKDEQIKMTNLRHDIEHFWSKEYLFSVFDNNNLPEFYSKFISNTLKSLYETTGAELEAEDIWNDYKYFSYDSSVANYKGIKIDIPDFKGIVKYSSGYLQRAANPNVISGDRIGYELKALDKDLEMFKIIFEKGEWSSNLYFIEQLVNYLNSMFRNVDNDNPIFHFNTLSADIYRIKNNSDEKEMLHEHNGNTSHKIKNINLKDKNYKYYCDLKVAQDDFMHIFTNIDKREFILPIVMAGDE